MTRRSPPRRRGVAANPRAATTRAPARARAARPPSDEPAPPAAASPGPSKAERERIRRAFLAMALSHEIKQPLNSLNLNAELLSKRLGRIAAPTAELGGPLQALLRVVDRVTSVLDAFYARVQPDPVPEARLPLAPILLAAAARALPAARRAGVEVVVAAARDLPPLPRHADQLAVALDAVLANAIAASPRRAVVRLGATAEGDEIRVSVTDAGAGMAADVVRRAVEIGFSTHGADGTGLTVAKFVAYHHSGGFQVESRPGEGTTVTMVLPVGD